MALLTEPRLMYPLAGVAALALLGVLWWLRVRSVRRKARQRAAGYQLMDCLKAYTAWIDWHREEPLLHNDPAVLPAPLAQAVQLKDAHFPELSALMLELLQTHRELVQYLREENSVRTTDGTPLRPHYADPRYHNVRDRQDAALDSLFLRCRQLIGESATGWQRTRSDFSFSTGASAPSQPRHPA